MDIGRTLIILGVLAILLGVLFTLGERLPIRLGRLPGDIAYRGKNTTFYSIVTVRRLTLISTVICWAP